MITFPQGIVETVRSEEGQAISPRTNTTMHKLLKQSLLTIPLLLLLGCRTYNYTHTDQRGQIHKVSISTFLSNSRFGDMEVQVDTNVVLRIKGYQQDTDTALAQSIATGVATGVTKGLTGKP